MTKHLRSLDNWPSSGQVSVWVSATPQSLRLISLETFERYGKDVSIGPICVLPDSGLKDAHYMVVTFQSKNDAMMFKLSVT